MLRRYEGGGLLRHVRLVFAETTHIVPSSGVFVDSLVTGNIDRSSSPPVADASVTLSTNIATYSAGTIRCAVRSSVAASNGSIVWNSTSASVKISAGATIVVKQTAQLPRCELWDAELAPTLYTLLTEIIVNADSDGSTSVLKASSRETTFGVRRMEFDSRRGLLLNNRTVKGDFHV